MEDDLFGDIEEAEVLKEEVLERLRSNDELEEGDLGVETPKPPDANEADLSPRPPLPASESSLSPAIGSEASPPAPPAPPPCTNVCLTWTTEDARKLEDMRRLKAELGGENLLTEERDLLDDLIRRQQLFFEAGGGQAAEGPVSPPPPPP
eukprot:Sspe_Gene.39324::Locus_18967_Transcript_1_1_Confidence_1.000_Length_507::g.39324::m.39324